MVYMDEFFDNFQQQLTELQQQLLEEEPPQQNPTPILKVTPQKGAGASSRNRRLRKTQRKHRNRKVRRNKKSMRRK